MCSSVLASPCRIGLGMNREAVNTQLANEARLLLPTLAAAEATVEQLQERVQSTIRAENQTVTIRAAGGAELRRQEGTQPVETVLQKTVSCPAGGLVPMWRPWMNSPSCQNC